MIFFTEGASFLARNCGSKNNREEVVRQLINTSLRVDSLSSCLHNIDPPPGSNINDKADIMKRYLFHLAFENQNTPDYMTEKMWGTLMSGTIPVVMGPVNMKDQKFPEKSLIYVNDFSSVQELAKYLIKVASNETLYDSHQKWRVEALPQAFLDRHMPVAGGNGCRLCRWAHARKYGLGWDHQKQALKSIALSRETCLEKDSMLKTPAVESWFSENGSKRLQLTGLNQEEGDSFFCPLKGENTGRIKTGGNLFRTVWSNDGTTDILISGDSRGDTAINSILRLVFPMREHHPIRHFNEHFAWLQDEISRISFVVVDGSGQGATHLISSQSGRVDIKVKRSLLPLRIRIIIEDLDLFHKGADQVPTYYGQTMFDDVFHHPELFITAEGEINFENDMKQIVESRVW
jgi:hypothetical protein